MAIHRDRWRRIGLLLGPAKHRCGQPAPINASYGEVTGINQTIRNYGSSLGLAIFGTLLINANAAKITATLTGFGVPESQATNLGQQLSEGTSSRRLVPSRNPTGGAGADCLSNQTRFCAGKPGCLLRDVCRAGNRLHRVTLPPRWQSDRGSHRGRRVRARCADRQRSASSRSRNRWPQRQSYSHIRMSRPGSPATEFVERIHHRVKASARDHGSGPPPTLHPAAVKPLETQVQGVITAARIELFGADVVVDHHVTAGGNDASILLMNVAAAGWGRCLWTNEHSFLEQQGSPRPRVRPCARLSRCPTSATASATPNATRVLSSAIKLHELMR